LNGINCILIDINSQSYSINLIDDAVARFISFDTATQNTTVIPTSPDLYKYYTYGGPAIICFDIYYSTFYSTIDDNSGIVAINLSATDNKTNNTFYYDVPSHGPYIREYSALACSDDLDEIYGATYFSDDNGHTYNIQINILTFDTITSNVTVKLFTEIKNISWGVEDHQFTFDIDNEIFYFSTGNFSDGALRAGGSLYIANLSNGHGHGPYIYPYQYNPYITFPPSNNGNNIKNFNPNYFSGVMSGPIPNDHVYYWCNFTINYDTNNTNIGLMNECEELLDPNKTMWFSSDYQNTNTFCGNGIAFVANWYPYPNILTQYSTLNPLQPIARYSLNKVGSIAGPACFVSNK